MKTEFRSAQVVETLDRAEADGGIPVFRHETSDLFVHEGALCHIEHVVALWSSGRGMPTVKFSLAGGAIAIAAPGGPVATVPPGVDSGTPPTIALDVLFDSLLAANRPHSLIIDFPDGILPDASGGAGLDHARILEQLSVKARDVTWRGAGHRIVLIERVNAIDSGLLGAPGLNTLDIGLPEEPERRAAINQMLASSLHPLALSPSLDEASAAAMSGGMRLDTLSRLRFASTSSRPLDHDTLLDEKNTVIRQMAGDSLYIHDERWTLGPDIAGLPQVARYLADMNLIGRRTCRVLLAGPPGVGKTLVAVAMARRAGTIAVSFGLTKDRWVGESERKLTRAIEVINAVAPVTVIIDEADQNGLGRRASSSADESSGVESSMRAIMLSWLGDIGDDNGISVVAITNEPDGIDTAFLDRLEVIPVLAPSSAEEMAGIANFHAARSGVEFDRDGAERVFGAQPATFSGRQIVRLMEVASFMPPRTGGSKSNLATSPRRLLRWSIAKVLLRNFRRSRPLRTRVSPDISPGTQHARVGMDPRSRRDSWLRISSLVAVSMRIG